MKTLENKVALVTGGGQGIGQGIAYALADEGAAVAVVGRTTEKLDATVTEIMERGGNALAITADVTDPAQLEAAVATITERLGGLDVLVNNAQAFTFGPLLELDLTLADSGWASGPRATLHAMQLAHPYLGEGGCVVNLSSGAVLDPGGVGAYAASKAAIESLTRAAAVEWGPQGIRVNAVIPFARTPATQAVFDAQPGFEDQLVAGVPLRRIGDPERDIGRVVAFLASPEAAYITGTTLVVDGGASYLR